MDTYQNDNGGKPVQPPQVRAFLVAGAAGRCIHYKAMCTTAAKFMAFTFQAHCEPKCTGGATFWAFRAGQLLARAHTLVPHAFRRVSYSEISVPLFPWTLIISFSGPPFAQPRIHVSPACWDPLHGGPTSRGSIPRDLPAVQPAASRDRGFTWFPFRGSCLTVLLSAPRAFSQSPCGMTVSDQLVKDNFLSIGVSPVTLACFPVGSTRVVSGRFLSHSFGPAPLARSPACHLDLFPAHSFWLLPAPVHPQRSCGISRPGRESTQLSSCWLLRGVWRPQCTQPLQCPGEHK